eukprot:8334974-Lingulodinium_polyedra.AAC.1
MPARTLAFRQAKALGRAMRVVARTGHKTALPIYNIYGFPGGHEDKRKALRTNAIVEAIIEEMLERGDLYAAI